VSHRKLSPSRGNFPGPKGAAGSALPGAPRGDFCPEKRLAGRESPRATRVCVSGHGHEAVRVEVLLTNVCSQEFIVAFKPKCWKNKRGEACLGAAVTAAGYDAGSVVKTVCP